jgi:hypothetical protein
MRQTKFLALALVIFSLVFSSCSSEDSMAPQSQNKELFKTYQLKRDATGAYSLDVNVEDNVKISNIKNETNNTNELHLAVTDDNFTNKTNLQSDLFFNDENFKIDFITENSNNVPSISVFDDNIKFAKKSDTALLKEYSITKNENDTYDLNFKVVKNVTVDFVFNAEINVYEVHLQEGEKAQSNNKFSRTLEKKENVKLEIHFVNHLSESAKSSEAPEAIRKPIILVDN